MTDPAGTPDDPPQEPGDREPGEPPREGPAGLVFPTDFPIKIMGLNELDFEPQIVALVQRHAPDLDLALLEVRQSSAGKYLSLTVTVRATSRDQLDTI